MSQLPQVICVTLEWSQRSLLRQKHTHRSGGKKSGLGSESSPGALWAGQVIPPKSTKRCIRDGLNPCTIPAPREEGSDRGASKGRDPMESTAGSTGWRAALPSWGWCWGHLLAHEVSVQAGERSPSPGMLQADTAWVEAILSKSLQPVPAMAVRRSSAWRGTFCMKVNSKLWVTIWNKMDVWGRSRETLYYISCNPSNKERIGCSLPLTKKLLCI